MNPKHLFPILLGALPAHAALVPTLNTNGRTIHVQTETAGNLISLADLQAIITARGDLTTAAVLSGEATDGTTATNIAEELANGGNPALFTFANTSGTFRYSRNDAAALNAGAATSGGRFGLTQDANTWTLGSILPQGVSHFGAIFYGWAATGTSNLVSVRANFSDGSFTVYTATAATREYTFVGFAAPEGASILSIQVNESPGSPGDWMAYDDIAIVLAEPEAPITAWTGAGDDANWSTGENWQSGNPPAPGDLLTFAASENVFPVNDLAAGASYGSISFLGGSPAYEIEGNAISPGADLYNLSASPQALLLPLQLDTNLQVTNSAAAIYLDGPISGPHAITKSGSGLLQLTAANTYSGGLTVIQGTVELDNDQTGADRGFAISPANQSASTLAILADGTAAVAEDAEIRIGALTPAGAGTGSGTLNVVGDLDNAGALKLGRAGLLSVSGIVNQSGPASVEGVGGYGSTLTINSGGEFNYLAETPLTLRSGSNGNGRAQLNIAGGLFVTGQGVEQLPSLFTFVSPLPIPTGIVLSGGGTIRLSAPVPSLFTPVSPPVEGETPIFRLDSGGGYIDTNGHSTAIDHPISGDGALTKEGTGTLTLSATNTHTGGTYVDEGTLITTTPDAFADDSSVTVAFGATLNLDFPETESDTVAALTLGPDILDPGTYDAGTHSAYITGSGSITVANPDPYIDWIASFPSITDPADREKSADADDDGLINLLEFALDGDPSSGAASGKIVSAIHEGHLTLTLPVRAGASFNGGGPLISDAIDGLAYRIEGSRDFSNFDSGVEALPAVPAAVSDTLPPLTPGGGWEYRSFRLTTPISDAAKGFLRADVTDANP